MALRSWLFVYSASGLNEAGEVTVMDRGSCRTVLAGFPSVASAMAALGPSGSLAEELARAELVELCGAFGAAQVAAVDALGDGRVAVGLVTYTGDMTARLAALFG